MNRLTPAPPSVRLRDFRRAGARGWGAIQCRSCCVKGGRRWWRACAATSSTTTRRPARTRLSAYPEVKSFLKKQEKNGAFPAKPPEKTLGRRSLSRAVATLRALETMAEYGLGKEHPGVARRGRARCCRRRPPTAASPISRWERRPSRARARWRSISRAGRWRRCAAPATTTDARVEKGFRFLLTNRQADGGWAWRGVRTDSAARPSSHLVTGMALRAFAASATRRTSREARRAAELLATRFLQPDRYPDRKAANLLGTARRAALLHRRPGRARLRHRRRPRQGELRRPHRGGLRARAPECSTGSGTRARPLRLEPGAKAPAPERQGPRARALADRAGLDRPPPRQLGGSSRPQPRSRLVAVLGN